MRFVPQSANGVAMYLSMYGDRKYAAAARMTVQTVQHPMRNTSPANGEKCSGGRKWSYDISTQDSRSPAVAQVRIAERPQA